MQWKHEGGLSMEGGSEMGDRSMIARWKHERDGNIKGGMEGGRQRWKHMGGWKHRGQ